MISLPSFRMDAHREVHMKTKTLESSIALRLLELTVSKPSDRDAFVNHMDILNRVEAGDLNDDGTLLTAATKAAEEFSMGDDPIVKRVLAKLATANDPLRASTEAEAA
jgi:hypothetical protein